MVDHKVEFLVHELRRLCGEGVGVSIVLNPILSEAWRNGSCGVFLYCYFETTTI